ncbi:P-loop NTPase fold protein [Actinosynnema sp. NPDC047251]|uniref:P-loop NTPase fold protein n=1 Tax=Saccharothrix espanaensis TaxID=103731 RepID=UPI0002EF181E|nr:P-loop NTPase fold protein [Saccharothrix espanaensis]
MKIRLIADQAIGETDQRDVDGLGFDVYARVLASAATDTRGPFTIGVFGEWGTGKTSLIRMVERNLSADENVVTVWFNAWRYEQEEHPIVPLVGTIVRALEEHAGLSGRFGEAGRRLVRSLRAIAYGFSAKSKVQVPGFAEFEASFVAKDMIDRNAKLTPDPLLDRSLYFGAFNSLENVKLREDLRVIILIDDLDRCFPDQAIRLLESIKLVLAQPGFIFVLGVARKVVEGYLQHRYSSEYGIADFKGELYLDKIVQLPFHIPPSTNRMAEFCRTLLADQPADLVAELQPVLPSVADALGGNPRAVIRFINNILIDHAISSALPESGEGGIPIRYFAVSRCLEHRWPDVFEALTTSDQLADDVANWTPESYADKALGSGTDSLVATKLVSDRELRQLLTGAQGRDWLTDPVLRQASVSFLVTRQRLSRLDTSEIRIRYDAFVSFPDEDRPIVIEIVERLTEAGVRVYFDEHIPLGARWEEALNTSLDQADTLLYCVGKTTGAATGQLLEYDTVTSRPGFSIIPVILPGANTETLPDALRSRQWLDFRTGVTDSGMKRLISTLHSKSRRG